MLNLSRFMNRLKRHKFFKICCLLPKNKLNLFSTYQNGGIDLQSKRVLLHPLLF